MARRRKSEEDRSVALTITLPPDVVEFITEPARNRSKVVKDMLHQCMQERAAGLAFMQQWMDATQWLLAYYSLAELKKTNNAHHGLITLKGAVLNGENRYKPEILAQHFQVLGDLFNDSDKNDYISDVFPEIRKKMQMVLPDVPNPDKFAAEQCRALAELCEDATPYQTEALIHEIEHMFFQWSTPDLKVLKSWTNEMEKEKVK